MRRGLCQTTATTFLIATLWSAGCGSAPDGAKQAVESPDVEAGPLAESSAPDKLVDVWLVPVGGFPAGYTDGLVRRLQTDLPWLHVRAAKAVERPSGIFFPEHEQVVAQKALEAFGPTARALPETKSNSACVFLIADDLNLADRRLRFTFSVNDRNRRTAIVSAARMKIGRNGPASPEQVQTRLYKMVKRQIGELRIGLTRTSVKGDLMYSPLMSLDDLDEIGTEF